MLGELSAAGHGWLCGEGTWMPLKSDADLEDKGNDLGFVSPVPSPFLQLTIHLEEPL